eukprot:evm.model.NODE_10283_length_11162_cov_25.912561.3
MEGKDTKAGSKPKPAFKASYKGGVGASSGKKPWANNKMQQGQHKRPYSASGGSGGGGKPYHSNNDDAGGPANKKRHVKYERAKTKPAFDLVARAKAIWAIFRSKRLDKDEREKLSDELYSLIKGKLHQIAVKHDAARVVQAALKHGNRMQQEAYITELLEYLLEFSKVQYAHFIVLRLLDVTATIPSERKRVLRVFANKAHTLATHAVGAKVLEGILSTYPKQETQALRAELYGRETTLLLGDLTGSTMNVKARDLQAILAELPERREKVLSNVLGMLQKMLVKDLVTLPFVQELLWEYVCNAGPVLIRELVPTLVDYLLLLTGTRPGCKVLAECAAYGTPKDRKKMLKALKGYVIPTLLHKDAYLFLLRLADVVDDTVAFNKAIWTELLEKDEKEAAMLRFVTHVKASKLLLCLLAPTKRDTFLMKDEVDLLKPAFIPARGKKEEEEVAKGDGEGDDGENKKAAIKAAKNVSKPTPHSFSDDAPVTMVPTSKKDAERRRQELLEPLKDPLIQLGTMHAHEMLLSAEGSFILYEVATRWRDPTLLEAIAQAAVAEGGIHAQVVDEKEEKEGEGDVMEEERGEEEGGEEEDGMDEDEDEEELAKGKHEDGETAPVKVKEVEDEDAGPPREHRIAYKTIKRLILFELGPKPVNKAQTAVKATAIAPPEPLFCDALFRQATGRWMTWLASIRGGFLVEALVKVPVVGPKVMQELAPHEAELKELAVTFKGAAAVRDIMMGGAKTPPKKAGAWPAQGVAGGGSGGGKTAVGGAGSGRKSKGGKGKK